jgi:methyltransferase (TIGR00027 family)
LKGAATETTTFREKRDETLDREKKGCLRIAYVRRRMRAHFAMRALRVESRRLFAAGALAACVARALARAMFQKRKLPFAVSDSSRSIAALRAIETERGGAGLFADPFAAALAGEAALARVRARGGAGDNGRIAIRTRFFDDAVKDALARCDDGKGPWQVVLLGAGLDTRAWRLTPPASAPRARAVFEVDVREVLDGKHALLRREPLTLSETYAAVRSNLNAPRETRGGWARGLRRAGHDPSLRTAWVLEGLLYYLEPRVVDDVLRGTASLSAPGSVLVASVVNRASLRRATSNLDGKTKRKKKSGAKSAWASHCDAPARAFAERGWGTRTVAQPGDPNADYGRWRGDPPPPHGDSDDDDTPRTFYVVCDAKAR